MFEFDTVWYCVLKQLKTSIQQQLFRLPGICSRCALWEDRWKWVNWVRRDIHRQVWTYCDCPLHILPSVPLACHHNTLIQACLYWQCLLWSLHLAQGGRACIPCVIAQQAMYVCVCVLCMCVWVKYIEGAESWRAVMVGALAKRGRVRRESRMVKLCCRCHSVGTPLPGHLVLVWCYECICVLFNSQPTEEILSM